VKSTEVCHLGLCFGWVEMGSMENSCKTNTFNTDMETATYIDMDQFEVGCEHGKRMKLTQGRVQ
jgi:hypothetical protein